MILEVNELGFSYKDQNVLKHLSFAVEPGKITVILGPNGAGKTTLLKCLNALLAPQQGQIRVKGRELRTLSVRQVAREIAYVAQQTAANRLTAFDAILMGRRPHIHFRASQKDLEMVDGVIRHLNLSHLRLTHLDRMSGGELQQVAIARALVQETDLLLMDEPTTSLDLKNQAQLLDLLQKIVKSHDIAAILTMHDLNAALRHADRFILLKEQTLLAAGSIGQITPELVAEAYGIEVDIVLHKGFPVVIPVAGGMAA